MSAQASKKSYKGYYITAIVIVIIVILFVPIIPITYEKTIPVQKTVTRTITYTTTEPYQVTKSESKILINDKPTVPAGKYLYYQVYIDVSGKSGNVVSGSVVETAGYDIRFYVFDQKGFNAWKNGYSSQPYVDSGRITSYSFSFVPDHSDYYYFVLDNGYSWFTNKVPQITATWNYQETVTEYRTVEKTQVTTDITTDYEKISVIRYVSLFQLLTGTY